MEPNEKGTYPVVIYNRGGNRDYGTLTIGKLILSTSRLAAEGYVIIGSNYREEDVFGGKEINDVLYVTETVKKIEKADPNGLGMFGWSRGGMMTYLALQKSNNIKTAIIGNGVSNLFKETTFRPKMETQVFAACIPDYYKKKGRIKKTRCCILS